MATEILGSTAFYTVSSDWGGYYLWIYSSYDRQRSGGYMQYKFYADVWITSGAWYNNNLRWIVKINGNEAYRADTGGQSGSNWKKNLYQGSWYQYPTAVYSGTLPVTFQIYDTQNSGWCNWSKSGLSVIVDEAGAPSISASISKSSASRGSSNGSATASISTNGGTNCSVSSWSFSCNGSSSTSITGLKNNTSYSWSASITNSAGRTGSNSGSFYLTPHAPSTPSVSVSTSRTGATFSVSTSYDTSRKHKSTNISYGKSTSYGSSSTSTSLSSLTPNTTYYYSVTVTDQNNGGAYSTALTSSARTGSFTTTGNAPSISSVTPDVFRSKAILNYNASYDTNDSFSSLSIRYGTSTSYGSTSTSTTLNNLQPNTTYYYSMTVTSSRSRTSSAYTGSFKTTAYLPSGLSISASNTLPFSTNLSLSGNGDTNAGITNYTYYYRTKPTKPIYDMPIKTLSDGSNWARIFYHNNKNASVLFTSLVECKNTQTTDKYSRMYLLEDDTYKLNGKFEFMLCYPIDAPGKYNRWRQTNAPQNEYVTRVSSGSQVTGYEAIHIDWTSNYWGGLERYQSSAAAAETTWLDGSVGHGNWFYAIGSMATHGRGIPSYDSTADVTELWVRIDDGVTSTVSMGTGTTAAVSGLSEETNYIFYMSATNAAGTNYSGAIEVITPADQAKIRRYNQDAVPTISESLDGTTIKISAEMFEIGRNHHSGESFFDNIPFTSNEVHFPSYDELVGGSGSSSNIVGGITGPGTIVGNESYSYRGDLMVAENGGIYATVVGKPSTGRETLSLYAKDTNGSVKLAEMTHMVSGTLVEIEILQDSFTFSTGTGVITEINNQNSWSRTIAGRWEKGKAYYKKNGEWIKVKKIYKKVNGQWIIGTNYDFGDLTTWDSNNSTAWDVVYDATTGINNITVQGIGGLWEQKYKAVNTVPGTTYTVNLDFYNPNGYTPLSGYNGVECQAVTSISTHNDDTKIGAVLLPSEANANKQTLSFNFTATTNTTYITLNCGRAADNETHSMSVGNIHIIKN